MITRRYFYRCEREHQAGFSKSQVCGVFTTYGLFSMNEATLFRQAVELAENSKTFQNNPSDKVTLVYALNRI